MKFEDKFLLFIFLVLGFSLGLPIYKIFHNIPFITFDGSINIISAASLLTTSAIAILIPVYFKKFVDDNRGVKSLIEVEIKDIAKTLDEIKSTLTLCCTNGSISADEKNKINYIFETADLQIVSLEEQLKISFGKKSNFLIAEIKEKYFNYNTELTGGILMTPGFKKVTDDFRRFNDIELNKFVTFLKYSIHRIHRY